MSAIACSTNPMTTSTRPSYFAFIILICASAFFIATFGDAWFLRSRRDAALGQMRDMVTQLQLTDLCLFTEARYTRHLTQADLHSAFQDHPHGLEHFPTGSLVPPPAHLTATHARLDSQTAVPD